jgi:FkbM family methyltransferase
MIKAKIKLILHALFGFETFLYYFSILKIKTLKFDANESDIFKFVELLNERKDSGVVLDVGANIGIMTGIFASNTNRAIYAFEPLPLNYSILEKVINKLKIGTKTRLHKMALGNYTGECAMILPVVDEVKMHGLSHVVDESIKDFNEGVTTMNIPIDKLDNVLENESVAGIKLDVENFEFAVLQGAKNILQQHKPIVYAELWDNENRINCFLLMRSLGYSSYYLQQNTLIKFDDNVAHKQNFFFLPG